LQLPSSDPVSNFKSSPSSEVAGNSDGSSVNHGNNNNQAFYSQASWDKLEMKPHKNRYKTRAKKKGKTNVDKKNK
jgi:hypothetical protein